MLTTPIVFLSFDRGVVAPRSNAEIFETKSFDRGAVAPRSNARPPDARGGGAADEAAAPVGPKICRPKLQTAEKSRG